MMINRKFFWFVFTCVVACTMSVAHRIQAQSIPLVMTFQSILFNQSGEPVTDDSADLLFRLVNDQGTELYAEEQRDVEIFDGAVNILIGSGVEPGSQPPVLSGGIPAAVLDPMQSIFLEVTVGGNTTLEPLELTSVPYAYYALSTFKTAPGAVTAESIQAGAITKDHLQNVTLADFSGSISADQLPSAAVTDSELNTAVSSEASARTSADTSLQNQLSAKLNKNGTNAMSGSLNMGGYNITNVGTVDGVDVSILNSKVTAFAFGSLQSPSKGCGIIKGYNIISASTTDSGSDCLSKAKGCRVTFRQSAGTASYVAIVTSASGGNGTDDNPSVCGKNSSGLTVSGGPDVEGVDFVIFKL